MAKLKESEIVEQWSVLIEGAQLSIFDERLRLGMFPGPPSDSRAGSFGDFLRGWGVAFKFRPSLRNRYGFFGLRPPGKRSISPAPLSLRIMSIHRERPAVIAATERALPVAVRGPVL